MYIMLNDKSFDHLGENFGQWLTSGYQHFYTVD